MHIACPSAVTVLLTRLHEAGHEAYLVGGSLRDSLLGRPPHDWDIATSALPMQTLAVFADFRTIETGLKHGTVTVLSDDMPVEITTYRIDGNYLDARHPSSVSFTRSLDEDLARRDFTVCAMAWSPYDGGDGIVDLFGGREDLAAGIIRCVGQPEQRFREDALRILRAYRFASELSFTVEPETRAGARFCAGLLARISAERISSELSRTLLGAHAVAALTAMADDGVLGQICPEADRRALFALPQLPAELALRLALLFWHTTSARAAAALGELRFSGAVTRRVTAVLALRDLPLGEDAELTVRQLLRAGGQTAAHDLLALRAALGETVAHYLHALGVVEERGDCTDLAHLAVGGADLAAAGIPRGPAIGRVLGRLLDAVIADPSMNERGALMDLVRGM
ncbi:MAG: polynucleotide adenylyltransferase [Clostridia bacterium]|nr:polynucleotide adenylyltransferase [Clostridia bacterium]